MKQIHNHLPPPSFLRAMRKRNGRNQSELAAALEITQSCYSRFETGAQHLSEDQWVAVGPLLALDANSVSYRKSVEVDDLLFLLLWRTSDLDSLRFVQDEEGNVASFESGLDACAAARAMVELGIPVVAVPATVHYATIEALFHVAGASQALVIRRCEGELGQAAVRSAEFIAGAVKRALREAEETKLT